MFFKYTLLLVIVFFLLSVLYFIKYRKLKNEHIKLKKFLKNVSNTANAVRYGDLSRRIEKSDVKQTSTIISNINKMIESIEDRESMIKSYRSELENELQNINQVHKDFSATLMHDLKVPVIAEINAINLFLNGSFGEISDIQKQALETMLVSSEELLTLLNSLLETYKYEVEGFHFQKNTTCMKQLVEECLKEVIFLIKPKNQTIELYAPHESYPINLDKLYFKRVIKNLISNASSYTPNNGIIKISLDEKNHKIILKIEDNGKGIEPEYIDKIFDKYFSTSKKFRKVGTGLGLYLTKKIVEKHNGTISVTSKLNEGTKFLIEIPQNLFAKENKITYNNKQV